ncbi:MAG: glycogen/starch synthase [Phycisphaerae bacterium]|nr:glycogen/starch synthase [Phycisphaerae bacterium]
MSTDPSQPVLFEISWETCRKIGGIYTVLRSKAPHAVAAWGDWYTLIGPYVHETASVEYEPLEPGELLKPVLATLRQEGIQAHFGRWLITGNPRVLLLDVGHAYFNLDNWKRWFWESCRLSSPGGDPETNDAVVFGAMVCRFFQEFARCHGSRHRAIAHFHEWMASMAIPLIRHHNLPVATLFTTHATLLGRYVCATDGDFYRRLPWMNPDAEAGRLNVHHRHSIERAAAHGAHVFTTVSEVTGREAEHLLGRRPEVVLPNGLRVERFEALHQFQTLHAEYKEKIHEFVRGHFFGSYSFDLDKTLYTFVAGRYEYRNKGIDLFIEALARLNGILRQEGSDVTVVAFLVVPAATHSMNVDVLKNRFMIEELRKACNQITNRVGERIVRAVAGGRLPDVDALINDAEIVRLKRMIYSRRRTVPPAVVTHNMVDDAHDPILNHLRHRGLFNTAQDRVKVVYHPEFIVSTNPLFGMDYEEFVRGCHLGVFPSYYEPWGYTPAECTVMGVPSVCSNLSGFGAFVHAHVEDHEHKGLFIVNRRDVSTDESIGQLARILHEFTRLSRRERIALRNRTERLSELFDWNSLYSYYRHAHELALSRAFTS